MDVDTVEFHLPYVTNERWVEAGGAHASKIAKRGAALFVEIQRRASPQNFFNNHRAQFEAFEHTFGSEAECKRCLRNRLDSDVRYQLNADQPLLEQEQSDYDWPWGWWND